MFDADKFLKLRWAHRRAKLANVSDIVGAMRPDSGVSSQTKAEAPVVSVLLSEEIRA